MKYFCKTFAILLLIVVISGEVQDESGSSKHIDKKTAFENLNENMAKIANECINGTSFSSGDIQALIGNETVISDEVKCFQACMLQNSNIIDESNKLNEELVAAIMEYGLGIEKEVSIEICRNCNKKITEQDECEAAFKLPICIKNELKIKDIDVDAF